MDLLETIGVMPGDLGDFLGMSGYETWAGFELVFWFFRGSDLSTLHNMGYFEEGATKKNQILPSDTGKGILKESGPAKTIIFFWAWCFDSLEAEGVSTLQNLVIFHSLGYFLGGCH